MMRPFSVPKILSWPLFRGAMNVFAQLKKWWLKSNGRKTVTLKILSGPSSHGHGLWTRLQLSYQLLIKVRFVSFKEKYLQWPHTASDLGKGIGSMNARLAATTGKWVRFASIWVILTTKPMDRAGDRSNVQGCQRDQVQVERSDSASPQAECGHIANACYCQWGTWEEIW